jgi:acetyl-CoA carboxylase biotin carboxyl carrier protein
MLTYEQILELIDKLVETPLSEISLRQGEFAISLKKETQNNNLANNLSNINTALIGDGLTQSQILNNIPAEIKYSEPQAIKSAENLIDITSPMVGTFYASSSPDSPPFVEIGQNIKIGDAVCIIEAMKMMNELPAEINGVIAEICVKNTDIVEYGQVLFRVKAGS